MASFELFKDFQLNTSDTPIINIEGRLEIQPLRIKYMSGEGWNADDDNKGASIAK